jgi:very-short-patch-repair endonuclease
VARAAVNHLMTRPQETLLVATMNRTQQVLIDDLIDKICQENDAAREVVEEARNREFEKFIVRNLENVQGDQRDVIFISFTYGKDPESGKPLQRWGPITGKSGRRRLNVLFSRAKMRVEAFTSLVSQDVNAEPGVLGGVNDLKNYLRFIQDGILYAEGQATGEAPDSDFEVSVMNVIRAAGLVAIPQVGVASYRVDIGVCRPGEEGSYILGVECDGAGYHSSKWARDRDRIREEVLHSRGWNLYRVWSTDWFRQHEDAKTRLLEALRKAAAGQSAVSVAESEDEELPVVQAPITLSKIAAASGASIYEVRGLAWKLVHFAGDDREIIPTGQAAPILAAAGCRAER